MAFRSVIVTLVGALLVAGCLPIPDVQVPLLIQGPELRVDVAEVVHETRWISTPPAPGTPVWLNGTGIRRTHLPGTDGRVVIIAMPGLFSGAAVFDPWARQVVASEPGVEVWAIDRRSNALEDRDGIRLAIEADDPEVALRYYGPGGAHVPLEPAWVPYLAHWGLAVHLRDLHEVVLKAREEADVVLLAGHSLGAGIVSVYAAARIAPEQGGGIGEDHVDGLILLDGSVGRTGALGRADERISIFGITIVPGVDDLVSGRAAPFLRGGVGFGQRHVVRTAVAATFARLRPDDLAPPGSASYPVTNRALMGIRSDSEYATTPIFSASVGTAVGARFGGNVTAFVLTGREGATSRTIAGLADGAEYVDWSPGDPTRDVTDLDDIIAQWTDPAADPAEWYFPLRLAVDVAQLDPRLQATPGFVPMDRVVVPALAIGAGRGVITNPSGFQSYVNTRPGAPIAVTVVPGLTHHDVLSARANPTIPIVLRWLRSEGWIAPRPR